MLEPIPQEVTVKKKFEEHYRCLLGDDYEKFMQYSLSYIRKAIRVNTNKISVTELKKRLSSNWNLEPIPWCKEGFWITHKKDKRFDIGNIPEHALGYIYIQEAASMIPPVVLDPKPGELVLDMCASPGSKSSQLCQYMENTGVLVCNELTGDRIKPLGLNLQRMGCTNIIITKGMGQHIKGEYDKILVDAPCSGVGTIRKSLKTLRMWNMKVIEKLSRIQLQLAEHAFKLLKPGGSMVYSTCTLEPLENEYIVSQLIEKYPDASLEPIKLKIKQTPAFTSFEELTFHPSVKNTLRIHPYDNDTEGFFIAKIKKKK